MAIPHAAQGQRFDIPPLGPNPSEASTQTLFKTPEVEVMRMVVLEGKVMPTHSVAKAITVQCLEGRIAFTALGQTQELSAGQILYLDGGQPHSLEGIEHASILLTILM